MWTMSSPRASVRLGLWMTRALPPLWACMHRIRLLVTQHPRARGALHSWKSKVIFCNRRVAGR